MTQVDFYILPDQTLNGRELLACRLAEKAFRQGRYLYIHTESESQSELIDELLWSFREGSFVPHLRAEQNNESNTPVLIGHEGEPPLETDVLITWPPMCPCSSAAFSVWPKWLMTKSSRNFQEESVLNSTAIVDIRLTRTKLRQADKHHVRSR